MADDQDDGFAEGDRLSGEQEREFTRVGVLWDELMPYFADQARAQITNDIPPGTTAFSLAFSFDDSLEALSEHFQTVPALRPSSMRCGEFRPDRRAPRTRASDER